MNLSLPDVEFSLLLLFNAALNGLIFGICICRLGKLHNALWRVKAQYAVLLVASAGHGGAPVFFKQWPTGMSIVFVAAVLYMLVSDGYQWKNGAPKAAETSPAPLEPTTHAQ